MWIMLKGMWDHPLQVPKSLLLVYVYKANIPTATIAKAGRASSTDFPLAPETHCPFCQWPGPKIEEEEGKKRSIKCMIERSFFLMKAYRRAVHSFVHCSLLEGCYRRGYPERNLDHFQEDSPWHSRAGNQNLQTFQTDTFGNTLEPWQLLFL